MGGTLFLGDAERKAIIRETAGATAFDNSIVGAERTFWEKATILHQEANRPAEKQMPLRYSRHYYDLFRLAGSPVKDAALARLNLLRDVARTKMRFYPSGWAKYEAIEGRGELRLAPPDHRVPALLDDYASMSGMIYGGAPDFSEVLSGVTALEAEIGRKLADAPWVGLHGESKPKATAKAKRKAGQGL